MAVEEVINSGKLEAGNRSEEVTEDTMTGSMRLMLVFTNEGQQRAGQSSPPESAIVRSARLGRHHD